MGKKRKFAADRKGGKGASGETQATRTRGKERSVLWGKKVKRMQ